MQQSPPEADPPPTTPDDRLVRWIPVVVPLMALYLAVMVLIVEAVVL